MLSRKFTTSASPISDLLAKGLLCTVSLKFRFCEKAKKFEKNLQPTYLLKRIRKFLWKFIELIAKCNGLPDLEIVYFIFD